MIKKILMIVTVLVLLFVVLVIPILLGERGELSPSEVMIDHSQNETRIYVQGAVETYRHPFITIEVRDLTPGSEWNKSVTEEDTISTCMRISDTETTHFQLNVTIQRGEDIFLFNSEVLLGSDADGEVLKVYLPEDDELDIWKETDFPYTDVISERLEE